MTGRRHTAWLLIGMLSAAIPALAQAPRDGDDPRTAKDIPDGGFWPTKKMIDRMIVRVTEDMSDRYLFTDDQLGGLRGIIRERFPSWMAENRAELQGLMNEYIEALLDEQPPSSDEVADWANRALTKFNEFSGLIEETSNDMRGFLDDQQLTVLEGDMAVFNVGSTAMKQKLAVWSEGGFDPLTEWPRSREFRERQRQEHQIIEAQAEQARREAVIAAGGDPNAPLDHVPMPGETAKAAPVQPPPPGEPGDDVINDPAPPVAGGPGAGGAPAHPQPARPEPVKPAVKDEMTFYVEAFIERYDLRDDQKQKCYRLLKQAQDERARHLKRNEREMTRTESALRDAKSDEQRARAQEAHDKARAPLAKIFDQLKARLDYVPTRAQRAAVQSRDSERRPSKSAAADAESGGE